MQHSVQSSPRSTRELWVWLFAGLLGFGVWLWSLPRHQVLMPAALALDAAEAREVALERLRDLGPLPENAYVVVRLSNDSELERRMQLAADERGARALGTTRLAERLRFWQVVVYPPGAQPRGWSYRATLSTDGRTLSLRRSTRVSIADEAGSDPIAEQGTIEFPFDQADASIRAREFLERHGVDLSGFVEESAVLRDTGADRADIRRLRFADQEQALGDGLAYGLDVAFVDGEIVGFAPWLEDAAKDEIERETAGLQLSGFARSIVTFLLLPLVAVPFLRRYHAGLLGIGRGAQIGALVLVLGVVWVVLSIRSVSEGTNFGLIDRPTTAWVMAFFIIVFQILPMAAVTVMAWSAGESYARGRWPSRLASFDALLHFDWNNATLARSALRGVAGGFLATGSYALASLLLRERGIWALESALSPATAIAAPMTALVALAINLSILIPLFLFTVLFVPAWTARRLSVRVASWTLFVGVAFLLPVLAMLPPLWNWLLWLFPTAVVAVAFWRGDLLSSFLTLTISHASLPLAPLILADDRGLALQAWLVLLALSAPMLVSLRSLGSGREFVYAWDDVPPHVRRIAERERQQVELETAREIQAAILPSLPERVGPAEVAYLYRPASEVGGDFYDVLELDDRRLVVAVGDVAGHGVSSGLVMSGLRSALSVQVRYSAEIEEVFERLNAVVHGTHRRRLLATLIYAVVDLDRGRVRLASAGHLGPYLLTADGEMSALETIAYPLGVRDELPIAPIEAAIGPGDTLVVYSDGLVEARPDGSNEMFGFERLETTLADLAGRSAAEVRDGLLAAHERFVDGAPPEDDVTVVVVRF
ncbi:MAG: PP2C family protein-serine/threonine phosphatase [Acidobacteriota bacterium]